MMERSNNWNKQISMKRILTSATVILLFAQLSFAGGPWTQKQGVGFYKLSEWWTIFDQHYTDQGLIDPNVTTGIFNTFLYAEHGITDRLTGIFNGAVFSRNYMNNLRSATTEQILVPGEGLNSIGDIDIGFKYALNRPGSKIPIAASIVLGIPTGNPSAGTQGNLQTGDGEFNQMIQIDAGKGFVLGDGIQSYVSTYVGLNHRTQGFSEEFRYGVEAGLGLMDQRLWLITRFTSIESFKNGDTAETITSTSIFANNSEFTSLSIEANFYVTGRFGVSVSAAGALRGEIIAAAPSFSAGVFLDLSK